MKIKRKCLVVLSACFLTIGFNGATQLRADAQETKADAQEAKAEAQKAAEPAPDIKINGLTGEIIKSLTLARPGTTVIVEVCPADFINYAYKIEKTEKPLREAFEIVGVEPPAQATGGGPGVSLGIDTLPPIDSTIERLAEGSLERELLERFRLLRRDIVETAKAVSKDVRAVETAFREAQFPAGCTGWPKTVEQQAGNGRGTSPPFFQKHDQQLEEISSLEARRKGLLAIIEDLELLGKLPPDLMQPPKNKQPTKDKQSAAVPPPPQVNAEFLNQLKQRVGSLQSGIEAMGTALSDARKKVDRWARIIALHPEPKLRQSFLMPQLSNRISFSVSRTPITPESRNETPPGTEIAKIEPSVIAVTTFESRALSRFNVSLGMVGASREDDRDFEVAPSVDAAGKVSHRVRETKRNETATDPAAFLGIYLNRRGVDQFDLNRKAAGMVMLGSEISSSPKNFFLGLGLDWRQGVVAGLGVTEYEGVSLAEGWRVDQEIATGMDNKPVLATVPKVKKDTLGAYLFLGFRPSIFRAFLDRRKP